MIGIEKITRYCKNLNRPTKIAYFITNKCNSKCRMCNVHKQQTCDDLQPSELKSILNDPLFSEVKSVGLSGGEPTMNNNAEEIITTLISELNGLRSISLTTNAINYQKSFNLIEFLVHQCLEKNIKTSIYLSLDGIGETHDLVRGVKGNFASLEKLIEKLKENEIEFKCATTVSNLNIDNIEEIEKYCNENGINNRYRLASRIGRLDNHSLISEIQLDDAQKKHFTAFLKSLNTQNTHEQRIYRHIENMLAGNDRNSPCPHAQKKSVCLTNNGSLAYCSVASEIIGNCLKMSALKIYKKNLSHLKEIKKNKCRLCTHDIT